MLCAAMRYECSPQRVDVRASSYERKLQIKAGVVGEGTEAALAAVSRPRSLSANGDASRRSSKRWSRWSWLDGVCAESKT